MTTDLNYTWVIQSEKCDTVILFLHEALGSIGQWKSFPADLCEVLNLSGIIYERQGHGMSPRFSSLRNANYLHDYALKELPDFIDYLRTVYAIKEFILVGHSDGGSIALLFAAHYPKNIKCVVTMAAHVINEKETIAGIDPAVKAYENGKLSGLSKYHGDKTEELFYAWANIWRDPVFQSWNITDEIKTIESPLLSIQGKNDQYGTEKQLELIADSTGARTRLIDQCGHHPHLEQPTVVIQLIKDFVGSVQ